MGICDGSLIEINVDKVVKVSVGEFVGTTEVLCLSDDVVVDDIVTRGSTILTVVVVDSAVLGLDVVVSDIVGRVVVGCAVVEINGDIEGLLDGDIVVGVLVTSDYHDI